MFNCIMRRQAVRLVLAMGSAALFCATAGAQQLPQDPALVTGQLENGMHYIVRRCSLPPGRAVMWIHMHTGSLNETDEQRGIAHYLEHMAFNGSENFQPGSLIPFFESMGMTFGRDQNAFTNYDQTTFQLSLPKADSQTLGKGMTFFADVVGRLSLLPSEIDNERQIILEERRRGLSARQRTSDYIDERLYPGSLFGFRDPIGTEATIKGVNQQNFKDYVNKWYGASNATLIVIADADPQDVVKEIKENFGPLPAKPRPAPQELNVTPYARSFAIVATDPELTGENVRIIRIEKARPPTTTEQQYRDDLVASLGTQALNRRFGEKSATGDASFRNARVSLGNTVNAIYSAEVSGTANAGKWRQTLEEIALEVQRGRAFGFTAHELDVVKKEMMSNAERAVETEPTTQMSGFVSRINNDVAAEEPTMSAQQRLDLLKKYLPSITPQDVSERFATEFDFSTAAFVATLPSGKDVPTETQLLDVGTKALAVKPTPEKEISHATTLLATMPEPGKVVEGSEHTATQVWNGWLSNNVNIHYRFMDENKDQVSVRIALIGGELLENAENRGITSAAQLAWGRAATKHLSSTDIRELMAGKKINVGGGFGGGGGRGGGRGGRGGGGGGGGDSISLSISGAPEDLETGFQLAYLLLTEPKIEAPSFTQFQETTVEMLAQLEKSPTALGARTVSQVMYPESDPRVQPTTAEQIERLTLDSSQAWLEKLIKESPIEVTIVGDIPREKALDLCARYLGALPTRERVDPVMFDSLRHLKRPVGPRTADKVIETPTDQAFVYSGFYGVDESDRDATRFMNMAARILSMRMTTQVREQDQLVYSISASSRPGSTYPGFGVFAATAPTDPAKVAALVTKLASMYAQFAKDGPSADELAVAKKQMATTWAEQVKQPQFWVGRLNMMTFRNVHLDDILTEPDAYQAMTINDVQETFAKCYKPENTIVVTARPASEGAAVDDGN